MPVVTLVSFGTGRERESRRAVVVLAAGGLEPGEHMSKRSNEVSLPSKLSQGTLAPVDGGDPAWEEIGFRGPQVCRIVGISYRQLDYWARTELLTPSLAEAHGSGTQRSYSYRDLVALKVIKSLLDAGVALKTARVAIDYLRDHLGGDLATASLVLDGSRSVLALTGDDIVDLVRHGQGVLNIVPLGPVVAELAASIHELDVGGDEPADAKPAPTRRRKAAGGG